MDGTDTMTTRASMKRLPFAALVALAGRPFALLGGKVMLASVLAVLAVPGSAARAASEAPDAPSGAPVETTAPAQPPAARTEKLFSVRYVSTENVYLAGGTADGLAVGDTLSIERDGSSIGHIVVEYTAEHSASAKILEPDVTVRPGDRARGFLPPRNAPTPAPPPAAQSGAARGADAPPGGDASRGELRAAGSSSPPLARVSGSVAVAWEYIDDTSDANLDFATPTLRLDVTAREILGGHHTLRLRGRLRHDDRTRTYSTSVPESEWRDRIYVLSLKYDDESATYGYELGRIAGAPIGGIGYLDGALVSRRVSSHVRTGLFGGYQPDWRDADPQGSIQKAGGFARYQNDTDAPRRIEGALSLVGEYHGSTISREFMVLAGRVWARSGWSLSQSTEIDLNRNWRLDQSGERVSLTSIWVSGQVRPRDWLNLSLVYDGRTAHLSYDTRSLPDRLIDDAFREGLRGRVAVRATRDWNFSVVGGVRRRQGDDELTRSLGATIVGQRFPTASMGLTLDVRGFAGEVADGVRPTLRLRRTLGGRGHLGAGGGAYLYRSEGIDDRRESYWMGVDGGVDVGVVRLGAEYERRFGDDLAGHRLLGEVGVRF